MKYAGLRIESVVMHQVLLKRASSDVEPVLSDAVSPLDEENRAYIQMRIRETLGKSARPIVEEKDASIVPDLLRSYFNGDIDLVSASRDMARLLQRVQHGISPGGIFLCASGQIAGEAILVLAKFEHEQGVRATQSILEDGSTVFDVQLLHDLLITSAGKVFKVAMFDSTSFVEGAPRGVVVDRQAAGSAVAAYFLGPFLGCQFAERSDFITERFHNAAQAWINSIDDAEKKGRYEVALLGDLQSNRPTLSVNRFATEHLDLDDRDRFVQDMHGSGVPAVEFEKDIGLVATRIKRLKVETETGVMVLAPPESISTGVVSIEGNDDETSTVTVVDRVTRMSGAGAVRTNVGTGPDGD